MAVGGDRKPEIGSAINDANRPSVRIAPNRVINAGRLGPGGGFLSIETRVFGGGDEMDDARHVMCWPDGSVVYWPDEANTIYRQRAVRVGVQFSSLSQGGKYG